jgi:hypothetical protein
MTKDIELLASLYAIRSTPAYHAAEVLRRATKGNALGMATAPEGSDEHSAVVLLISTWETIALMIMGGVDKDKAFEVTPVGHMYGNLKEAIERLGKNIKGYASNFEKLNYNYDLWLSKQDTTYQTAARGGIHALFG